MSEPAAGTPGRMGPHQFYEWRGSAYEVGFQHGRVLRDEIVAESGGTIEGFAHCQGRSERDALARARQAWEPLFREHVPRVLEEIRGMADGGGFEYDWMFFAALHGGTKTGPAHAGPACTAFACGTPATRDGAVLMGQTKDTAAPLSRYRIMRLATNDGPGRVMLNYPGWITHVGLSSHGLFNTCNSLCAQAPAADVAPLSFLRCLVSEKASVDDVLRAMRGLSFDNGCTMIGDRSGRLVCIETAAGQVDVRDVSAGASAHANSILSPSLQRFEDRSRVLPSSDRRQATLQRLLDQHRGRITVDVLKACLADHTDGPLAICRHGPGEEGIWTTAAVVADLTAGRLQIAIGAPCVAPFVAYDVRG